MDLVCFLFSESFLTNLMRILLNSSYWIESIFYYMVASVEIYAKTVHGLIVANANMLQKFQGEGLENYEIHLTVITN